MQFLKRKQLTKIEYQMPDNFIKKKTEKPFLLKFIQNYA